MNTKLFLSVFAALTISSPAFAKKAAKPADKKAPMAETYKVDAAASTIEWKGSKATGSSHNGTIAVKSGEISVNDKKEITNGKVVADMASLTDKDLEGSPDYKAKLETHLKSEDFFNVAKNPESTFTIKSVTKKAGDEYTVKGDLNMIGKTQPIEFPATVKWEGEKLVGTADIKLDRTKWGLKYGSGKFFKNLGDKLINDEFELKLNLTATK